MNGKQYVYCLHCRYINVIVFILIGSIRDTNAKSGVEIIGDLTLA